MKNLKIRTKDAAYQKLEVLSTNRNKRYRYFEFLIEGVRNINEAVKNGWEFSSLIFSPEAQLSDWAKNTLKTVKTDFNIELSAPLMAELSEKEDTSELMAVVKMIRLSRRLFAVGCGQNAHLHGPHLSFCSDYTVFTYHIIALF